MKYSATAKDFDSKLKSLITKEKLIWFLTPIFNGSSFCGTFDNDSFSLNLNTSIRSLKPFYIKGIYKKSNNNYNIIYEIDSTKASKVFSIIVIIIAFIIFNLLAFSDAKEILLFPNIIISGFVLFGALMQIFIKHYIKRKFEKLFELENIDSKN